MRSENAMRITRRDAMRILGAGVGLTAVATSHDVDAAIENRLIIRTILEDLPPDRLTGTTLIHEHLSMSSPGRTLFYDDVRLMVDEVKACAQNGVSCIVDTGNAGLGRHIDALRSIATLSGVHIVACGG